MITEYVKEAVQGIVAAVQELENDLATAYRRLDEMIDENDNLRTRLNKIENPDADEFEVTPSFRVIYKDKDSDEYGDLWFVENDRVVYEVDGQRFDSSLTPQDLTDGLWSGELTSHLRPLRKFYFMPGFKESTQWYVGEDGVVYCTNDDEREIRKSLEFSTPENLDAAYNSGLLNFEYR